MATASLMIPAWLGPRLLWLAMMGSLLLASQATAARAPEFSPRTAELLLALKSGNETAATVALERGADINEANREGQTPLTYAVSKLERKVVAALLALGANPNLYRDDGTSALSVAYEMSALDPTILELLIGSGRCDLNAALPDGEPLLYHLIESGKPVLIALALQHGANPSARTGSERPLVVEAVLFERYDEAQLLLDAGASPASADSTGRPLLALVKTATAQSISPAGAINKAGLRLKERLERLASAQGGQRADSADLAGNGSGPGAPATTGK